MRVYACGFSFFFTGPQRESFILYKRAHFDGLIYNSNDASSLTPPLALYDFISSFPFLSFWCVVFTSDFILLRNAHRCVGGFCASIQLTGSLPCVLHCYNYLASFFIPPPDFCCDSKWEFFFLLVAFDNEEINGHLPYDDNFCTTLREETTPPSAWNSLRCDLKQQFDRQIREELQYFLLCKNWIHHAVPFMCVFNSLLLCAVPGDLGKSLEKKKKTGTTELRKKTKSIQNLTY